MSELLSKEMQQQLVDRIVSEFCERMPEGSIISNAIEIAISDSMPHYIDVLGAIEHGIRKAHKK